MTTEKLHFLQMGVYLVGAVSSEALERYWLLSMTPSRLPNKITGANAGGPRQLPIRTRWAARVAQFCRSTAGAHLAWNPEVVAHEDS